jgi:hypothetical protein
MISQFQKLRIDDLKQYHEVLTDLCSSILKSDPKITFVSVINEKGGIEEFQTKGSILDSFPASKREIFFMGYALQHGMKKDYDEDFGQVGYTYEQREKRILYSFPMMNFLLIVGCKLGIISKSIVNKIIKLRDNNLYHYSILH